MLLLITALAFAGCVAPVPKSTLTRSGKAEVEIASTNVAKMKAMLIGAMIDHGFTLEKDSEFMIEFSGPLTGGEQFSVAMTFGNASSHNWKSYSFMFVPTETGTRVIGSCEVKAQLAGGQVNAQSLNDNGAVFNSIQSNLVGLKRILESPATPAELVKK